MCVGYLMPKIRKKNVVCVLVCGWGWMCEKQVFWSLYWWKTRRLRVKDHIWPIDSTDMKRSESMCFVFCCVKDTHYERQRRSGHWGGDAQPGPALSNTVLLCDCPTSTQGHAYSLLALNQSSILGRGSGFEAPFSLALWSIHPVMNEEAVKGGKAGVCFRVFFVCMGTHTLLSLAVSVSLLKPYSRSKADHALLSSTHSLL